MTAETYPRRHARRGRKIALVILLALLAALAVFLIMHRQTVYYIFNPGQISVRAAGDMRERLQDGQYNITYESEDEIHFTALDGAVNASVSMAGDEVTRLQADFNAHDFRVNGVGDAVQYAHELLGPFFTGPQIEGLAATLARDMLSHLSDNEIDYTRALDGYTLHVRGDIVLGDIQVEAVRDAPQESRIDFSLFTE